jgi:hypothetical protein
MATRVSFGRDDVAVIDWSAALLVDREPDDVRSVLEFANLQLLEVRFLDSALDRALDRSYEVVSSRAASVRSAVRVVARELAEIGSFEVDGAILFERVGNAIKLVGDQVPRARLPRSVAALPARRVERGHPAQARDDREHLPQGARTARAARAPRRSSGSSSR